MIRITCSQCQKPLSIDETKLPMREVTFPCPVCKAKLTVDRRELAAETPQASPPPVVEADEEEFGAKALLFGVDSPAIRQAIRTLGFQPVHVTAGDAARDFFIREYPEIVFIHPEKLTPPPLADAALLLSVNPADRRKGFFILVADTLRTLDGNAAFLYGVNLVVATKDLGSIKGIYREADLYHKRMYEPMIAARV